MIEKNKKRQIAKISVFITSIFVIFLSVTYAFINVSLAGTKRQVITAGNLELELQEDENNLTITDAMPMYDEVGMIQEAFTFRLMNKTATDTNYIVKLVDIETGEKLDTNIVKYGLTKDGTSTIKLLSTLTNGEIDSGTISGNQTINYSLRLWIDSSVEDNATIKGKSLSYRIDIEASQDKEISYVGMIRSTVIHPFNIVVESALPKDNYWEYREQITSVVFENKIDIPNTIEENKIWDVSHLQDESVMAYIEEVGESETTNYKLHIQGNGKVYANVDSSYLFMYFKEIVTIEGLEYFDTSNVTDMSNMFYDCNSLTNLDISNFDTSNVTNMSNMLSGCISLTTLDLSSFDTSNVTNMSSMFSVCVSLTNLDISNFDISNVKARGVFGFVNSDCNIFVKNNSVKTWVEEQNSDLTNVTIKNA